MSDFLKNLRSTHKKGKSDTRKNIDGNYFPRDDRRKGFDRRKNQGKASLSAYDLLSELIPDFLDTARKSSMDLETLIFDQQRLTDARIEQINAVTRFFDYLNKMFENTPSRPVKSDKPLKEYTVGSNYTKSDVMNMIRSMRANGATFAVIADHLIEKGIPTFSGRGQWHAQTVHRLCK